MRNFLIWFLILLIAILVAAATGYAITMAVWLIRFLMELR